MMTALALIQQTRKRLLQNKNLNAVGFFLPVTVMSLSLGLIILRVFSLPQSFIILPAIFCLIGLVVTLRKIRNTVNPEIAAALLDDRIQGKERFLTLVTTPQQETADNFYAVIQQQAEQLSSSFHLKRDLPFSFDRRILVMVCGALCSLLLLFFLPRGEKVSIFSFPFLLSSQESQDLQSQEATIAALEKAAQRLLLPTAQPQEQIAGAQLLSLVQQLKESSLSRHEKQQLIKEAQKRWNIDLPLPQLLPFDLKLFANQGKDNKTQGNQNESSQGGENSQTKVQQNPGQLKNSSSSGTGSEPQQTPQQNDSKQEPRPRQDGGGISFNLPNPQDKNQKQSAPESAGAAQKPAQSQAPDNQSAGTDPNRPGERQNNQSQASNNQSDQRKDQEKPGEERNKKGAESVNIGQGKGERFLKSGDQPGGGFLTQDAHFVKVRVPLNRGNQGEEDTLTANTNRATPKTPYSNAPLKEGVPNQGQSKQPIPLEYRSILSE
jgi:hypothetical protein